MTSIDKQNQASATHGNFEHVSALLAHMRLQWLLQHFPPRLVWAVYVCINGFVTIGLLARRTVPAIAITLAIFTAVQVAVPLWVRPHLISPVRTVSPLNLSAIDAVGSSFPGNNLFVGATVNIPGAWVYSNQVTTTGGSTSLGPAPQACTSGAAKFLPSGQTNACNAALGRLHLRQVIIYQPGSRYWAFQWSQTAIFLALALLLTGFCIWWTSRRLSR